MVEYLCSALCPKFVYGDEFTVSPVHDFDAFRQMVSCEIKDGQDKDGEKSRASHTALLHSSESLKGSVSFPPLLRTAAQILS